MGMDRNTVIGFVLIAALLFGMLYMNSKSSQALQEQKKREADSIAAIEKKKIDTVAVKQDALQTDSFQQAKTLKAAGGLKLADMEELVTVVNDVAKITFTNKGGQPKTVELKNFKTPDGKPLVLLTGNFNRLEYEFNNPAGSGTLKTGSLNFIKTVQKENADKSQTLTFSIQDSAGKNIITHEYVIKKDEYMLDFNVTLNGADKLVTNGSMNLQWKNEFPQAEKDITYEKQQAHLCYVEDGKYDFTSIAAEGKEEFDGAVNWVAVNPQFFVATLAAKEKFKSAEISWVNPADSLKIIAQTTANLKLAVPSGGMIPLQLYYGPNDYHVLDKYGNNMHQIVTYGSGPFAFVKYINRHFLLPIWDFLRKHVGSYGIIILLLTLIIRLITSPILYKSYLSGAKMKVLKPDVDALKAKLTDKNGKLDQQAFSMEQMKLWKSAGVSPLGGCLPALLQIPIFMSLYYFFQANISLRGESFLWAKDLASYDSILQLPFNIPFYGDHVSLFTLTATITSLLISIYSMSNMQDNTNPVMKYMPYIFPVLLLGVFNNLPSALTWYYTVSNTITLLLQIVIQKYIINHDKILEQIAEKRKQPVKQSKLQARIQAMQEQQKKIQEMKNKPGKN
jgi:YidC/Oxa1 family membrane protein insertase